MGLLTATTSPLPEFGAGISFVLDLELETAAVAEGADVGSSSSISGWSIFKLFACGSGVGSILGVAAGVGSTLGVAAGVEMGENSSLNADFGSSSALDMVGVT